MEDAASISIESRSVTAIESLDALASAAISAKDDLAKNRRHMAVLFADLCDSTSYKLTRGDVDGLLKTWSHNYIVGKAVEQYRGEIVKYIGDEVMATFSGDEASENAVQAAIRIQNDISAFNSKIDGHPDEKITSKIAIHAGTVILAKFEGHEALDPQGKVVDATARIMSLCNAGQILCSEQIKSDIKLEIPLSQTYHREVKGIQNGINVFEIILDNRKHRPPKNTDHTDLATERIARLFEQGVDEELAGKIATAASRYESILSEDPLHFGANYRLARLGYKYRRELKMPLSEIQVLANNAEVGRSASGAAKAQGVIAAWAAKTSSPQKGTGAEEGITDEMIEKARTALSLSRIECDRYAELMSMNVLAWFLATRFESTKGVETYKEAEKICQMAEHIIHDFEGNLVPAFLDTYARVLIFDRLNPTSLAKAKELADRSMKLRETTHVHRTLAQIVELLDGN